MCAVINDLDLAYVGLPCSVGLSVRMGYVTSESNALSANIALCHLGRTSLKSNSVLTPLYGTFSEHFNYITGFCKLQAFFSIFSIFIICYNYRYIRDDIFVQHISRNTRSVIPADAAACRCDRRYHTIYNGVCQSFYRCVLKLTYFYIYW